MSTTHSTRRSARVRTRYPGVYYRELADGSRSYQVCVRAAGRLVWKTVPGGERDAVQARATIISELGRGKKIAPTRATFEQFGRAWLESQKTRLGERTIDEYDRALRLHLNPAFGTLRLSAITEDRVAALITKMRKVGYASWTIRGTLVPLGRILGHAVRKGHLAENPVRNLEREERPTIEKREQRILSTEEIRKLLAASLPGYRPALTTAILTGAREMELLGLKWRDVDFDGGVIRIREQLSRKSGERKALKTSAASRDVVLAVALANVLRRHKAASEHSLPDDYVFCTASGKPQSWSNLLRRGLHAAFSDAELRAPRPRFHDLRHTYASLLIAKGADVVAVSNQLGHADPSITLKVYAHLFEGARHSDHLRSLLDGTLGTAVSGNNGVTRDGSGRKSESANVVELSALSG